MNSKSYQRLVIASSIDGRIAFHNGGKGNLGGKGDREVLENALAWSDATLMGSKTLEIHKNTCIIHNKHLIEKRLKENRSAQPLSIIVSKKQSFSSSLEFFDQPIERGLLSPNKLNKDGHKFNYYFRMQKNWSDTITYLNKKGYLKILILGGIKLIESMLKEDQIDELQITLTPRIIGGEYTWIPHQMNNLPKALTTNNAWILEKIKILKDNEIMLRYLRKRT